MRWTAATPLSALWGWLRVLLLPDLLVRPLRLYPTTDAMAAHNDWLGVPISEDAPFSSSSCSLGGDWSAASEAEPDDDGDEESENGLKGGSVGGFFRFAAVGGGVAGLVVGWARLRSKFPVAEATPPSGAVRSSVRSAAGVAVVGSSTSSSPILPMGWSGSSAGGIPLVVGR